MKTTTDITKRTCRQSLIFVFIFFTCPFIFSQEAYDNHAVLASINNSSPLFSMKSSAISYDYDLMLEDWMITPSTWKVTYALDLENEFDEAEPELEDWMMTPASFYGFEKEEIDEEELTLETWMLSPFTSQEGK